MKVLLKWNMTNVWSISMGGRDGSVVQLIPGANEVKKEDWDKIKDHPEVKARMKADVFSKKENKMCKKLEILAEKKAKKENDDGDDDGDNSQSALSELKVGEAQELVKETYQTPLLREWLDDETRKGVVTAIESQLKKIEDERANSGDDEDNIDPVD